MQTRFTPRQLAEPRRRRERADPAQVRALRFLHRDVPDVRAARRRARQPARPHLSDQGDARERPARDGRGRAARRPLPVVPRLHDDLPVGRALSTSDRSRARARRAHVSAAVAAIARCARCSRPCCRIRGAFAPRSRLAALARPFAALLPRRLRAMLELAAVRARPRRGRGGAGRAQPRRRRARAAARARRAAHGLRAERARPRDQRRDDPPAAARGRGGRRGSGLLRRDRPSPRARGGRDDARRRDHRAARGRARRARASTRSSRTRPVAARRRRTTAICSAITRRSRRRRRR